MTKILANMAEPGKLVKEYGLSGARLRQIVLLSCLSLGMASVCWLPALFETNENMVTRIGISFLGLFVSLPFFVGIYQLIRMRGVSLNLYENGLIYRRRGFIFATTWDEIDSYLEGIPLRITKTGGQSVEFGPSIDNITEAADAIREQTLQRMLPNVRTAINNGLSVQFKGEKLAGNLLNKFAYASSGFSADAQGLTWLDDGNRIAWGDVTDYGISQARMGREDVDVFFIADAHSRYETRYGLLSNAHVLMALCDELTGPGLQE